MSDASTLCTRCGFCCDGTLFSHTELLAAEAEQLQENDALSVESGRSRLAQPCQFLHGTCCAIYAERFKVCRNFRCELLKKLQAGGISLDAASAIVAEARRWRSEALSDTDPSLSYHERLRRRPERDGKGGPQAAAEGLKLAACRRFLVKHFINPSKAKAWGWKA
jgi:Fe-S-cluster containining protein